MALDFTLERLLTEDIFSLVGMGSLSDDEKNTILDDMQHTVMARVYATILAGMSEADRTTFDTLSGDQLEQYLDEHGINLTAQIAEETVRYRLELATAFQEVVAAESAPTPA